MPTKFIKVSDRKIIRDAKRSENKPSKNIPRETADSISINNVVNNDITPALVNTVDTSVNVTPDCNNSVTTDEPMIDTNRALPKDNRRMTRSRARRLSRSSVSPTPAKSSEQDSDAESEFLCGHDCCEKPLQEDDIVHQCITCGVIVCDHPRGHCRIMADHDVQKHEENEGDKPWQMTDWQGWYRSPKALRCYPKPRFKLY